MSSTGKAIRIGSITIGGGNPIAVQSMTNTDTRDAKSTLEQVERLTRAGCEIVRCAVPDIEAATSLKEIVKYSPIPVVADVHFDYKLALASIEAGCHKLRLNPGNIKNPEHVRLIAEEAKGANVPIRVGANAGSLPTSHIDPSRQLCEAALEQARMLEGFGFTGLVLSVKSSDIETTIEANRLLSSLSNYPVHIGLTESGPPVVGIVRSTVALVPLLREGIGDTIRVSLTGDPVQEVKAAWAILETAKRRQRGATIISCPTCGRTHGDLESLVGVVEDALVGVIGLTVAVMGCEVNGPGEARDADCGIALGAGRAAVFEGGKIVGTYEVNLAVEKLITIARRLYERKSIHSGSETSN